MNGKKLYRSSTNRLIAGVCAGFAEYIGLDATLIRVVFAALCLAWGSGLLLYLICAILIPRAL